MKSDPSLMFPLHPAAQFLMWVLTSISSNEVLTVGCTKSFVGLLFLMVIRGGLDETSVVCCGEAWSLATTSSRVFITVL